MSAVGQAGERPSDDVVLIVEPNPDGHRLYYVSLLVHWCRAGGHDVSIVTTPRATTSPEWTIHLDGQLTPDAVVVRSEPWFTFENLAGHARSAAGLTVIPDGDRFLPSVALRGWPRGRRLSVLAMRPDAQPGRSRVVRLVRGAAKKGLIAAAGVRRGVRAFALRSPLSTRRPPLRWVADPVTLRSDDETVAGLRRRLEAAGADYWIGVFGAISARKHLHVIAEALAEVPGVGLLVAGEVDAEARELARPAFAKLDAAARPHVELAPPLDEATFDSAICAVDCVVVAHSNEGSSGVAAKAAVAGRRLVLAGARSLRRDAESLGDQAAWVPIGVESIASAVARAATTPQPRAAHGAGHEDFVRRLTWS